MKNTPPPLIIFDLDGTLAHTAPDLLATLNRIIAPLGLSPVSNFQVGQLVGHGAKAMIARAFDLNDHPLSEPLHDRLFKEFIKDYGKNIAVETQLYDQALEAMNTLETQGYTFCVCTNKTEMLARKLLQELNLTHRMKAITGGDSFDFRKPDERHLLETIRLAGGEPDRTIMIGDSISDIDAAKNAKIPVIGVSFGYSDVPVHELHPDIVIDHFNELPDAVRHLFAC